LVELEWALAKEGERGRKLKALVRDLVERWRGLSCFLREDRVPSAKYACERAIGRSKIRYKSMRGHKSREGLLNGVALTQRLGSIAEECRLKKLLVA